MSFFDALDGFEEFESHGVVGFISEEEKASAWIVYSGFQKSSINHIQGELEDRPTVDPVACFSEPLEGVS